MTISAIGSLCDNSPMEGFGHIPTEHIGSVVSGLEASGLALAHGHLKVDEPGWAALLNKTRLGECTCE